jgi:hypothetical protein
VREATSAAGPVRAALSRNSRSRIPSASLTGLRPSRGKLCDLRRIFASLTGQKSDGGRVPRPWRDGFAYANYALGIGVPHGASPSRVGPVRGANP